MEINSNNQDKADAKLEFTPHNGWIKGYRLQKGINLTQKWSNDADI